MREIMRGRLRTAGFSASAAIIVTMTHLGERLQGNVAAIGIHAYRELTCDETRKKSLAESPIGMARMYPMRLEVERQLSVMANASK